MNGLISLGGTPGEKTAHERKFLESYADETFAVGFGSAPSAVNSKLIVESEGQGGY